MIDWRRRGPVALLAALALLGVAGPARGAEITEVIDAFDGTDRFDFTFRVGYTYELTKVRLTQQCAFGESAGCAPDRPGVLAFRDIARYTRERHLLTLDAVFGLYHDLQFYTSWPIILFDSQGLDFLNAGDTVAAGNTHILRVPFHSADRSGVDWFSIGLSWLPFNQERNETLPTWLINFEARFAIGGAMRAACRDNDGAVYESTGPGDDGLWYTEDDDVDRDATSCNTEGGLSRRTSDLILQMTLSRRYGLLEPYIGFSAMISVPDKQSLYGFSDWHNTPLYAETHFGMEIIPWERRASQQFFRIGLHFWGGYHRETLEYTPLFDMLGTNPNMIYEWDQDDPRSEQVLAADDNTHIDGFSGMTRSESYGSFGGRLTLTMQAARYVKFAVGVSLNHNQEHYITFSDQCRNPASGEEADPDGPCTEVGGILVPETRQQIDDIGRRFRAEDTIVVEVFTRAFVQF